jgi:hypothetical protein
MGSIWSMYVIKCWISENIKVFLEIQLKIPQSRIRRTPMARNIVENDILTHFHLCSANL